MFRATVREGIDLALLEARHARELFELIEANRAHLHSWMNWVDQRHTVGATAAYITLSLRQFALNQGFHAGLWENGALCGVINTHPIDWPHKATSLEYWLAASHQGRGLMTASCRVVIRHLFGGLGLHRLTIRCAVDNHRSRAVAQRLGFAFEGIARSSEWLHDRFVDHAIYGLLETDKTPG
jgi:ribosomal-protein-serine acetyltransferase